MYDIFDKLPKRQLKIKDLDYFHCLCGKYQPEDIGEYIICANCKRIVKDKLYPKFRKT
jgi:hypothetical protein